VHTDQPTAILGGTFDPPHIGHLVLGECVRHQFGARLLFMPAGDPYRKRQLLVEGARVTMPSPAAHRTAMTALAIAGNDAFALDDREVRRAGPSYTVDTLVELLREGGDRRQLLLVLGSDAVDDMPNWKEPGRIRELVRILVALKPGAVPPAATPAADIIAMPPLPVSSTLIRARVAAGLPIRYLVPDSVAVYIHANGLYREGGGRPAP
jgi:nicotinate-nucleotide adenylyltransferase